MRRGCWPGSYGSFAERFEPFAGGFGGVFGGRWGRFFGAGELRLALLSLLGEGPRHGYDLMRTLEERSGGAYRASAGAIYPTLQQLEDEGMVASEQADGKRVYRILEAGKQELERNAEAVKRIWQRAQGAERWARWSGPEAAEVAVPAARVMKAAMRAATHCGGDPDCVAKVLEALERARKELDALATNPA